MKKLETIKKIKYKIEKGVKLNASESAVLIDVIEPYCNSDLEKEVIRLNERIKELRENPEKNRTLINEFTFIVKQTELLISIENLRNT